MLFGLAWLSPADWKRRLALAAGAAVIVAVFHAWMWPHCLSRLEGVSPEVERLWLSHVREARPVYRHGWQIATHAAGAAGDRRWSAGALLAWTQPRATASCCGGRWRRRRRRWPRPCCCSGRPAPRPPRRCWRVAGAIAIVVAARAAGCSRSANAVLRTAAIVAVALLGLGALVPFVMQAGARKKPTAARDRDRQAPTGCATRWPRCRPVALQPKGMVFTFVDLGPRLITVTHHDAVDRALSPQRPADRRRDERLPRRRAAGPSRSSPNITPTIC